MVRSLPSDKLSVKNLETKTFSFPIDDLSCPQNLPSKLSPERYKFPNNNEVRWTNYAEIPSEPSNFSESCAFKKSVYHPFKMSCNHFPTSRYATWTVFCL